ncbi:fungal-specific transcription factor domain-containing protein [Suillus placidus]|uniref:Fungal-specific transcription factor domain-containing protein n=1 Tax=Suillus placidus TaxID=48579 RepID=A0A9P7D0T3_9AGAM|nr:fungal-specific transcription factor domain-containing protein [Suillus placidus]
MPPDTTKGKLKRKSSRREGEDFRFDGGHTREIEQKRNNGQISCAECRRLKIKCDKQIPCQSCQRRGCAALCPNGSLATGQGTRFVLAATEHLHRQIANMSGRIRHLEDALGLLQSQHSAESHPLLRDDLRGADQKDEFSSIAQPGDNAAGPSNPPEILDAFGTLSITDHGVSRFFGPTGGSESDKVVSNDYADVSSPESGKDSMSPGLPQEFRLFSQAFPFTPMGPITAVQELIESHLPPLDRAKFLAQTYFEQAGWLFRSVSREQVMEELIPLYYSSGTPTPPDEPKGAHELGLLLLVFAIGALVDLAQDTSNPEAEHYHQLARAAICLQPVLEKPSLITIQALHLLSAYNAMSGNELAAKDTSMETTWSLVILAAHLSQTVRNRDSAKWGLPAKVVQRRRVLFWDLFVADAWNSLNTGRPPSFSLAYVDCRFPEPSASAGNDGESDHTEFSSWCIRYAAECVAEVATRTLTAEAPSYAVIMEIDRKVREFPFPDVAASASGTSPPPITEEPPSHIKSMGRLVLSHSRETLLLYIHRSFFAQAIIENPVNPLKSAYAPSFLAAYRAVQEYPSLCARFWGIWTFAFSAAIVFGTIVTRGPQSPLASNAMKELDDACLLFSKAAAHSRRAAKALPILNKLREKAHIALAAAQNERPSQQLGQQWSIKVEQDDDELEIFAGRTRFVSAKRPTGLPADYPEASSNSNAYLVAGSTEQQAAQIYRPEPAADWVHSTSDRGRRFDMHHSDNSTAPSASTDVPTQLWRQPQSSDYPYAPPHRVSHSAASHAHPAHHTPAPVAGPPTYWAPASETSQQYSQPPHTAPHSQPRAYQYNSSSAAPYHGQQSQPAPTELTGLGLVSQDSRLDERWTSFMRDSGYFDGVGYRTH